MGAVRARNGHPKPFHLKYLEIGNENGGPRYQERYALFHDALQKSHPEIRLIANEPVTTRPMDILDEHYYSSPQFFIQNATKYDSYDRQGPKIYVGEYAVTENGGQGNLRAALGEAAFMVGMERNSDVVVMASYAPLFTNVHYKKWNPDLINFDSARVYGLPSYYVQQLFARNRPDVLLPVQLDTPTTAAVPVQRGAIGVGTWATQAEYRDIKVVQGHKTLFASDFSGGSKGWRFHDGQWQAADGVLRQSGRGVDFRALAGDPSWTDYTLTLKARKLGGAEGFLILVRVKDDNNWVWWNIGGWGNVRHALERCDDGSKSPLGQSVSGQVETGRWYDVRVEVQGDRIRCFLDDRLINQAVYAPITVSTLHAVAGRVKATGEVILKVVNVSAQPQETIIQLRGVKAVAPQAAAVVLTSADPSNENSLEQPAKVAPVTGTVKAAPNFRHTFPANSLTVLRLRATP